MKFDVARERFNFNILVLLLSKILFKPRGITAVLLTASKKIKHWHALGCLQINLIQTLYYDRYYYTLVDTIILYILLLV